MRRRKFLIASSRVSLGVSLLPLVGCAHGNRISANPQHTALRNTLVADLENHIPKLIEAAVVPGASIAVIKDGKLLWRRGFGVKDNASKAPVDNDTVFEAASVSKTVFAYAVMKLGETGVVDLDKPLTRYTPTRFVEGDPQLDLITARHVLSHSSGFQDWRSTEHPLKIHFQPGEKFRYSGEGYHYLQSVVTQLKGQVNPEICAKYEADYEVCATDIDDYLRRSLLAPLGMTASGYVWNATFAKHAARPHDVEGKPGTKTKPTATDAARYAAAGGLHTTVTDYAKFLIEILDPRATDAFRLNQRSLKEMVRPQVKLNPGEKIDGADSWASGWAVQQRKTGNVIVHSGGQAGFRSLAMASVERKSGFIILTNGDNGGQVLSDPTLGDILNRLLFGEVF